MTDQEQALAGEILSDAHKRAERDLKRVQREADTLVKQAEREAQAEEDAVMAEAREQVERMERVAGERVEQDVAALRRTVHQQVVRAARAEARRRLAEVTAADAYAGVLLDLAVEAIGAMKGHNFIMVLRPEDRERFGEDLPTQVVRETHARLGRVVHVKLADKELKATGGLVMRDGEGHQVADQTFDARLDRLWDDLRHAVAVRLPDEIAKDSDD